MIPIDSLDNFISAYIKYLQLQPGSMTLDVTSTEISPSRYSFKVAYCIKNKFSEGQNLLDGYNGYKYGFKPYLETRAYRVYRFKLAVIEEFEAGPGPAVTLGLRFFNHDAERFSKTMVHLYGGEYLILVGPE